MQYCAERKWILPRLCCNDFLRCQEVDGDRGRAMLTCMRLCAGAWQRALVPGAVRPRKQEQAGRLCADGDPPAGCAQC